MIGIISDTHEQVKNTKKSVGIFKEKKVEFTVHCGDIISPSMLEFFKDLKMKIIFGNNDGERTVLNLKAEKYGFEKITETKEFIYEGKRFFVCHGHPLTVLDSALKSQKYDYILTGHTHKKRDELIGKTRIINPGSLFSDENSIATLDIKNDKLEFIKI